MIAIGFHRIGWHGFEAELDALGSTLMVEGRWLKFKIGGIAGVDIVSCAWIISMMYQGYSVLWPEAQILWISSSSAWARSCAARVIVSVRCRAEVVGHAADGAGAEQKRSDLRLSGWWLQREYSRSGRKVQTLLLGLPGLRNGC